MPPRRKQKSAEEKKQDAERQKKILSAKEKIMSTKRFVLSIIKEMIEKDVSKEWFLANCTALCHADYDDVLQERNIERLCGYALCNNIIKQTLRQKYHISRVTNKVYDLTERKLFCSNQCYKASNYLKAQLSSVPLYMRKEETIKVHLLSDCTNSGSVGEEIVFHHKLSQNEIDEAHEKEESETHCNLKNILDEEVKKYADSLADLKIKEHTYEKQYVFNENTPKKSDNPLEDEKDLDSNSDNDSDDSLDEKLFSDYSNMAVLSNKYMPVPEKNKKTVLITPMNPKPNIALPVQQLSLEFVSNVFKDWMTEDSFKYLLGEKNVYDVKASNLFQRMTATESTSSERLSSIKDEYIKLCLRIDALQDDDSDLSDSVDLDIISESSLNASPGQPKQSSSNAVCGESDKKSPKKVFKRRPKQKSSNKAKHVSFAPKPETYSESSVEKQIEEVDKVKIEGTTEEKTDSETKEQIKQVDGTSISEAENKVGVENSTENCEPEPTIPLIDSVSQNILRKQILTNNLKSAYTELLPIIGLHYTDVREAVMKFASTLSLTPKNITFKPKEWKLISVILLRMLTKTVLKDIHDEFQLLKLCEDPLFPIEVDVIEIEKTVMSIISVKNIFNVQ